MPFELGLACALRELQGEHRLLLLERLPHRLDRTLSDLKGLDPKIHHGRPAKAIVAVLESLLREDDRSLSLEDVPPLYRHLCRLLPSLKKKHGRSDLFGSGVYGELVSLGWDWSLTRGLLPG